jgi:hypothetical protein
VNYSQTHLLTLDTMNQSYDFEIYKYNASAVVGLSVFTK